MKRYNPKEIESRWQQQWLADKTFEVSEHTDKPKKYIIDMFPYPSGAAMHVGHVRNFTISDVLSQYHRQKGYNVMHTMGWDTFGLPAENYAIKTGTPPAITTKQNIANFKHQLQQLGMSYDWSREINTSDPEYYKWTQWIFTKLFENNLAYQSENPQWWCPVDKTVLANEQVEAGKCWRCGNEVIRKNLKQWFFRTTAYADALLENIEDLDWPEKIKTMQRNWIGKSNGAEIDFKVADSESGIKVFTTRPDTLFGATFMVLAPEHELVNLITTPEQKDEVEAYIGASQKKSEIERQENKDKSGVFTGAYAVNPVNQEKIPVWIADYVLTGYGTGAIMAVPGHDERDAEFAKKFNLPIVEVVESVTGTPQENPVFRRSIVAVVRNPKNNKFLSINWGPKLGGNLFVGGGIDDDEDIVDTAKREISEETGYSGIRFVSKTNRLHHQYYAHLKGVPRQLEAYGLLFELESEEQAEQQLEDYEKGKFTVEWLTQNDVEAKITEELHALVYRRLVKQESYHGEGVMVNSGAYDGMPSSEAREKIVADLSKTGSASEKINYKIRDWLISRQRYWGAPIPIIHCDKDGAVAVPQDQLPVILPEVESYEPTGEGSVLASVAEWVNTTCPRCGGPAKRETDTMDGYACSSWYFLRYTDPHNTQMAWDPEKANYWLPIDYYCGGDHAVSHLLYSRFWMHFFADQGWIEKSRKEPVGKLVYNGYILAHDGNKMSKSKGNVVNPDELIEQGYGADSLRLFEMFIAPYEQNTRWNTNGVPGTFRFLQRFWTLVQEYLEADKGQESNRDVLVATHKAIARVSDNLDKLNFNSAVAGLMEAVNDMYKIKADKGFGATNDWLFAVKSINQLLAPFAPHITEEIWRQLGQTGSVHVNNWPTHDNSLLAEDNLTIVIQINGKVRGSVQVSADSTEVQVVEAAKAHEKVAGYLAGQQIKKTVYVPKKLVSFVI